MIIDQSNPVGIDGVLIFTEFVSAPLAQESVVPGAGPVLREMVILGGSVGNTISLAGTVDDSEV